MRLTAWTIWAIAMIEVGLTAVADHPDLAANGHTSTLGDLAAHFPVVELDTTAYAIPAVTTVQKWQRSVPPACRFIVKATRKMTGHEGVDLGVWRTEFAAWRRAMAPLIETQQLAAALFQFPPSFGVSPKHLRTLAAIRTQFPDLPVAVEFRHASWYAGEWRAQTLAVMQELALIHVVVDEPQVAVASVPLVVAATNPALTIMRLHGRNQAGWLKQGAAWRSERTNYRYSAAELTALGDVAKQLAEASRQVVVIFNNNGHHDAAANAAQFTRLLGLHFAGLAPRQLDFFE